MSMRYKTLVARFWLRVRGVSQSPCRRQSRDKRQGLWGREWFVLQSRSQSPRYPYPAERETTSSGQKQFRTARFLSFRSNCASVACWHFRNLKTLSAALLERYLVTIVY